MTYAALAKLKKNSVSTTLTGDILINATTIPVAELNRFYDADGVLIKKGIVLGFDDATETKTEEITITGASATSGAGNLTGATRAVKADGTDGAAFAWPSGTKIAVMFSTGIYDQICDNIAAHESAKAATTQAIDAFGVPGTSNTDRDANTTNHGLLLKAVAPATGLINFVGIAYGETIYALKALFDATVPAVLGTAAVGSAATAARRDHVHSAELTLADGKSVELKKALGTDHTGSGITTTLTAHETTTLFQVGFINGSGEVALSDSDAASTMPVRAMAMAGINAGAAGVYMLKGFVIDASWSWTVGGILYASGTPGAMTQTAPTGTGKIVQVIGVAITATIVYFDPSLTWLELS